MVDYDWGKLPLYTVCLCPTCSAIESKTTWLFGKHEIGFPSDPLDFDFESARIGPWHWLTLEYTDKEKGIHLHQAVDFPSKILTETMRLKGQFLLRTWLKEKLYKMQHEENK